VLVRGGLFRSITSRPAPGCTPIEGAVGAEDITVNRAKGWA